MLNEREVVEFGNPSIAGTAKDQIVRSMVMSPEADDFLNELAKKSGLSEGKVLLFALGMFKTAIDAKQQGMHVGVARNSEDLEIELVGF